MGRKTGLRNAKPTAETVFQDVKLEYSIRHSILEIIRFRNRGRDNSQLLFFARRCGPVRG